jgi:hypothetical protein
VEINNVLCLQGLINEDPAVNCSEEMFWRNIELVSSEKELILKIILNFEFCAKRKTIRENFGRIGNACH